MEGVFEGAKPYWIFLQSVQRLLSLGNISLNSDALCGAKELAHLLAWTDPKRLEVFCSAKGLLFVDTLYVEGKLLAKGIYCLHDLLSFLHAKLCIKNLKTGSRFCISKKIGPVIA